MRPILTTVPVLRAPGPIVLLLTLAATIGLAGCGQRGPLYHPQDRPVPVKKQDRGPGNAPRPAPATPGDGSTPTAPLVTPATPVMP